MCMSRKTGQFTMVNFTGIKISTLLLAQERGIRDDVMDVIGFNCLKMLMFRALCIGGEVQCLHSFSLTST